MSTFNPLSVIPRLPPGGTNSPASPGVPSTSASLPDNVVRMFVFVLAALFLLGMSKLLPTAGAMLAIAITLAVVMKDSAQITSIANRISSAFGGQAVPGNQE